MVRPPFKHFPPNVKVLAYPVYSAGWRFFDLRRYGRDHRKILVVDDEVGFVGGYNIGSAYATEWRDTHCRITGPGSVGPEPGLRGLLEPPPREAVPAQRGADADVDSLHVGADGSGCTATCPGCGCSRSGAMYLEAIDRAQRNIWMTHAYFIPDENFVDSLVAAARRGVDVRLLLPAKSNHIVADWISRGYFGKMLEAGIGIHRFRDAMVHAKTATIDGNWTTIGTANVDRLSMTGNYEINVEIIDAVPGRRRWSASSRPT